MTEEKVSLIGEVESRSKADARALLETARKVAQREIDQATRRANTRARLATADIDAQAASALALAAAGASAEASRTLLRKKHELIDALLKETLERLAARPRDNVYLGVLEGLAVEAARALGATQAAVKCNAADNAFLAADGRFDSLAAKVKAAAGVTVTLAADSIQAAGGLVLMTPDARLSYYATFDEIAYRRRSELRAIIATDLFE